MAKREMTVNPDMSVALALSQLSSRVLDLELAAMKQAKVMATVSVLRACLEDCVRLIHDAYDEDDSHWVQCGIKEVVDIAEAAIKQSKEVLP